MEIRYSVIMSDQIFPDRHDVILVGIRRPVYELDLLHISVQEILELRQNKLNAPLSELFVD